ncbi:hypothetical protein NGR_b19990 (plasmid) [Sinorhizobium fredii NGR234]|uniref:Uncharacterized protein n=1 Tax=Sinorhizobium fredii (strain NBRC 101917 / NGR234) TaxID=394 RepID=C3KM10_SINFN|nr:hypothetical protein [Sinorhizobium fredii]ACP23446.1 hypothetical protein NGR_b19990 [Sinorhizobium fredii NGR234]
MDAEAGSKRVPCSEEEVSEFFDRMTSAQKRDAYRFAVKCATACLADADELISEAYVRMCDGRRTRLSDTDDLFPVLLGTIKSLASDVQFITERTRIRRMGSGKEKGKYRVIERDADHGTIAVDEASADAGDVVDRMDPDEYLKPCLAIKKGGNCGTVPFFTRMELERFRDDLRQRITVQEASPWLSPIERASRKAHRPTKDVIRLLLEGKLKTVAYSRSEHGYAALLVDPAEIRMKIRRKRRNTDRMTAQSIAKELNATPGTVAALVDHGHIPASAVKLQPDGRKVRSVARADFDAFRSTYQSVFHLAKELGTSPTRLFRELALLGVQPAFDRSVFYAAYYRRADIESHRSNVVARVAQSIRRDTKAVAGEPSSDHVSTAT